MTKYHNTSKKVGGGEKGNDENRLLTEPVKLKNHFINKNGSLL